MNLGIDILFANPQLKTYIFKNDLPNSNFQKIESRIFKKLNSPYIFLEIATLYNFSCSIKWHGDVDLF